MSASFFDSSEKLARLRTAAAQLDGTPFFANSEAPGPDGGMDCVHTLNWLYRTCGAIGAMEIPRSAMDAGYHLDSSPLVAAFETWPGLRERFAGIWRRRDAAEVAPVSALLPGDALLFRAGHVPHHAGVLLEHGEFLHTLRRDGVHTLRLDAVMRAVKPLGLLDAVFRPLPCPS